MLVNTYKSSLSLFVTDALLLTKARLTLSVVFSSVAGYLLAAPSPNILHILLLSVGGYGFAGASNAFNQIIEKEIDAKMKRTQNRPIPSGRMSVQMAFAIALSLLILGLVVLYSFNPKTAMFGAISVFLYTCAYTPLKTITPLSVFVGAIPGAIPVMLGWVAATNKFGLAVGILFAIQFLWQFPHFISISWIRDKEYKKAGFKMMYGDKKGSYPAYIALICSIFMTAVSVLPYFLDLKILDLSIISFLIILLLGIWFTKNSFLLLKNLSDESAKKLMLSSLVYLPLMQIIYVFDKWFVI